MVWSEEYPEESGAIEHAMKNGTARADAPDDFLKDISEIETDSWQKLHEYAKKRHSEPSNYTPTATQARNITRAILSDNSSSNSLRTVFEQHDSMSEGERKDCMALIGYPILANGTEKSPPPYSKIKHWLDL